MSFGKRSRLVVWVEGDPGRMFEGGIERPYHPGVVKSSNEEGVGGIQSHDQLGARSTGRRSRDKAATGTRLDKCQI